MIEKPKKTMKQFHDELTIVTGRMNHLIDQIESGEVEVSEIGDYRCSLIIMASSILENIDLYLCSNKVSLEQSIEVFFDSYCQAYAESECRDDLSNETFH